MLRIIGAILIVMSFVVPAGAAETPREKIVMLNDALLDVMKNADSLGFDGRHRKLQPVMASLYDFNLMSRVAVGGYWKNLGQADRDRLINAFKRMSIATYAARFDGYSGEKFEIVSEEKSVRNTVLVKTNLIKSDGSPVALNYLLRPSDGIWRIIDVFLDARFSELARLRADYTAVIKRDGFEKLINTIEARILELTSST